MTDEVERPTLAPADDADAEQETEITPAPVGAVLVLIGGALLILGSALDWVELTGGGTSASASGADAGEAWLILVVGIVVLAAGLSLLQDGARRSIALLAAVAASIGGCLGVYEAVTAADWGPSVLAEKLAAEFGGGGTIRDLLEAALDRGQSDLHITTGLYLLIAGGALGVVGGAIAVRRASAISTMRRGSATAGPERIPPPPPTGPLPPPPPTPEPAEAGPPPWPWAIPPPLEEEAGSDDGSP